MLIGKADQHAALHFCCVPVPLINLSRCWDMHMCLHAGYLGMLVSSGIITFSTSSTSCVPVLQGSAIVYREWAPAAQAAALIGDFSGWEPQWMTRDEWGTWSITLPDSEPNVYVFILS